MWFRVNLVFLFFIRCSRVYTKLRSLKIEAALQHNLAVQLLFKGAIFNQDHHLAAWPSLAVVSFFILMFPATDMLGK